MESLTAERDRLAHPPTDSGNDTRCERIVGAVRGAVTSTRLVHGPLEFAWWATPPFVVSESLRHSPQRRCRTMNSATSAFGRPSSFDTAAFVPHCGLLYRNGSLPRFMVRHRSRAF